MNTEVLALILGGGQGTRLFPLTHQRSKPAVPIGGSYRLIDIPISNCLHADIRRIFVLTQFNSASLNRHISRAYRMDPFSQGFVDILAAEQTPDNPNWYQGTADAVRQAARHFVRYDADYYLILAGDHLYRMDYSDMVDAHCDSRADITIAAQPVSFEDAPAMGIFLFDRTGQIVAFEEKPKPDRLRAINEEGATDFGRQIIPAALGKYRVNAHLFRGYWADVGTVSSFYDANVMLTRPGAPFKFYDPRRPIYTHARFLPGARFSDCCIKDAVVAEGCYLERATIEESVVGIRTTIQRGSTIRRSVLLGADYYEADDDVPARGDSPRLGIGRDVTLERVIVDKNARIGDGASLTNAAGVEHADGDGYYIRDGIVIVPKDGVIKAGTHA